MKKLIILFPVMILLIPSVLGAWNTSWSTDDSDYWILDLFNQSAGALAGGDETGNIDDWVEDLRGTATVDGVGHPDGRVHLVGTGAQTGFFRDSSTSIAYNTTFSCMLGVNITSIFNTNLLYFDAATSGRIGIQFFGNNKIGEAGTDTQSGFTYDGTHTQMQRFRFTYKAGLLDMWYRNDTGEYQVFTDFDCDNLVGNIAAVQGFGTGTQASPPDDIEYLVCFDGDFDSMPLVAADTTPPTLTGLNTNGTDTTSSGETVNLSAICNDETAAGQVWYSKYNESVYFNSTPVAYTNNIVYEYNITLDEVAGTEINLTMYCNDSNGNEALFAGWLGFTLTDLLPPAITFIYPIDKVTYKNYDGWLNFTTNENANCSLNASWADTGSTPTSKTYFNAGYGSLSDGIHLFNVSCWDSFDNNASSLLNFTIDATNPGIVTNLDANDTVIYIGSNLTIQANYTDNILLFSANVTTPEGFINYTDQINASTYTWDIILNLSVAATYPAGKHNITFELCDAHTINLIQPFDFERDYLTKRIKYKFGPSEYSIEPINKDHFTGVNTYKQTDSYIIKYDKAKGYENSEETYIVRSTEKIEIIGNNKYTGWLVIPSLKKWIDFETPEGYKAIVKRINDYEVEVTTRGNDFRSTGSLNCINHTVIYQIYQYDLGYTSLETEATLTDFNLNISIITSLLNLTTTNATLIYNNTLYDATRIVNTESISFNTELRTPLLTLTTEAIPFYWNYTINNIEYNTTTQNQTVAQFLLDNCTLGTNVTITLDIYDEETPSSKLDTYVEFVADYVVGNETKVATFTFKDASNYNLCLYPPNTNISADIYMKYNTSGGFTHRYYLINDSFTNRTKNISMYNFNDQTGISDLKGTLRDKTTYLYADNVTAKLQRYYVAENSWRTVQMDRSGDFGLIFFNIREEDTDYRFKFFDLSNNLLKTTESMKFVCTAAVCDLTFLVEEFTGAVGDIELNIGYSYNNVTGDINVSWDDTTGLTQNIRLVVTKETMTGTLTICDTTVNAASGTIGCNVLAYTGAILVRVFSTASPEMPKFLEWINKGVNKLSSVIPSAEGAFWSFAIMLTAIGFGIATGPIGAIITVMFGLIILGFLDLFGIITIGLITVGCILGIIFGLKVKR